MASKGFSRLAYVLGGHPALYEFFSRQPHDILTAPLATETNNLPTFFPADTFYPGGNMRRNASWSSTAQCTLKAGKNAMAK
jgi:hypothetical protein